MVAIYIILPTMLNAEVHMIIIVLDLAPKYASNTRM